MSILEDIVQHVNILETDIQKCESIIKIQKNTLSTLQILLKQLSNQQQYKHITIEDQYSQNEITGFKDNDKSTIDIVRKKKKEKSANANVNQHSQHLIGGNTLHNNSSKSTRTIGLTKKRKAILKTFEFCKLLPKFVANSIKSSKNYVPTITTPVGSIQQISFKDMKKSTNTNNKIALQVQNNGIQKKNMRNEIENEDYLSIQNNKRKKSSHDILPDNINNNNVNMNNVDITGTKNIFSCGKFKNSKIIEYCISLSTWYQKLEIAIDLHYCITNCPKRLQIFLDQETGTRDLLLSWIHQCSEYTSTNKITPNKNISKNTTTNNKNTKNNTCSVVVDVDTEEVIVTRIIEYCLKILNQAHWTAEDVNKYKFDRILKTLYKKHSHQNENHKQKIAILVKDMWSIYRVMRKNYENSFEKVLA